MTDPSSVMIEYLALLFSIKPGFSKDDEARHHPGTTFTPGGGVHMTHEGERAVVVDSPEPGCVPLNTRSSPRQKLCHT